MTGSINDRPRLFALGNLQYASDLATCLDADIGEIEARSFPDGEIYLRLRTNPAGRDVALVCTLDRCNRCA